MTLPAKLLTGVAAIATTTVGGIGVYKLTEPKTVREALIQKQKTILNTESSDDNSSQDQEEWKKITSSEELKVGLKTFIGNVDNENNLESKIPDLKKKCEEKLKVEKGHQDFSKALEETEKYCVKINQNS